jgi:hypothetical protein
MLPLTTQYLNSTDKSEGTIKADQYNTKPARYLMTSTLFFSRLVCRPAASMSILLFASLIRCSSTLV